MRNRIVFFLFLAFNIVILQQTANAVPGDYDGDGLADLALIDADEPEDKTTVFVRSSKNGSTVPYIFYPFGNYVISGQYFGNGRTYPGIVSIPGTSDQLRWHIKNPQGSEVVVRYGLKGDTVPNQGDLDCDGVTDFSVVRDGTAEYYPGFRIWYVALSGSPGAVVEVVFGIRGDQLYVGDTTGDGCAEMIALRGNFTWFTKALFGTELTQVQWGLPGDIPLLPRDMNGDAVPDYMVARPTGGFQVLYTRYSSQSAGTMGLGGNSSIPLVGNFYGADSVAWFDRSAGRFGLIHPQGTKTVSFGNSRRGIVRPDGTVVTEEESGRFSAATETASAPSSGLQCDGNINRKDGPGGFKNNPENSKGTIKLMFPSSLTGKIQSVSVYSGSDRIDTLRLGGYEWGNRERYYGRLPLSAYPEDLLVTVRLKDGRQLCVTIPDAEKVYD